MENLFIKLGIFLLGNKMENISNSAEGTLYANIHCFFVLLSRKLMVFKQVMKGDETQKHFL